MLHGNIQKEDQGEVQLERAERMDGGKIRSGGERVKEKDPANSSLQTTD